LHSLKPYVMAQVCIFLLRVAESLKLDCMILNLILYFEAFWLFWADYITSPSVIVDQPKADLLLVDYMEVLYSVCLMKELEGCY
jgi:hypothetical protein